MSYAPDLSEWADIRRRLEQQRDLAAGFVRTLNAARAAGQCSAAAHALLIAGPSAWVRQSQALLVAAELHLQGAGREAALAAVAAAREAEADAEQISATLSATLGPAGRGN